MIQALQDKLPPSAIEAECATLGSVILDYRVCDEVAGTLSSAEDFYLPRHATIYSAMVELSRDVGRIDMVLLTQKLADKGVLKQVGGVEYLIELFESVPSAVSAGHYAGLVREKAAQRRMVELLSDSAVAISRGDVNASSAIDSMVSSLIDLRPSTHSDEAHISHWLDESLEDDRPTVRCGMQAVDGIIDGFELGTLTVIGARPSVGKTAWGVSAALNMVVADVPVGFVSAEMVGRRVARRLVCADAGIDTKAYERDKHTEAVQKVIASQRAFPLWVDQTPGIHIDQVCGRIRRWKREHDIQVAFADYMQLFAGDGDSEFDRITVAARKLQAVAKETDVAVFALAQVNRASMQRQDKVPTMADLKGSGEIEQAADVVLLLHREAYCASGSDILEGSIKDDEAQIIVAKNRDGATGTANVGWVGRCGVFSSGIGA